MPAYDAAKTRDLLRISGAFAQQVGGDFIAELATQLKDAEAEITAAREAQRRAEADSGRFSSELESAHQNIRRLRDGSSGFSETIKILEVIARNPKGAKQLAAETLGRLNGAKNNT